MANGRLHRYLKILGKPIHPIRAIFEVCATMLFALPFLAAYAIHRASPFYVYLLYPVMFLFSNIVWFRLPFVHRRVRWILFWFTVTCVIALGAGFLYCDYRESMEAAFQPTGIFLIPHWVNPEMEGPFTAVVAYFLLPAGLTAAVYSFVLSLFLRIYRKFRAEEYRRRQEGAGKRMP
jgi:TRAP-type C4-dicarboxylate transport system permease small subunit